MAVAFTVISVTDRHSSRRKFLRGILQLVEAVTHSVVGSAAREFTNFPLSRKQPGHELHQTKAVHQKRYGKCQISCDIKAGLACWCYQCLKWRTPVVTSATPYLLQQSTASWSRMLPPGCAIAFTPALQAISTESFQANGKKASLAITEPCSATAGNVRSCP